MSTKPKKRARAKAKAKRAPVASRAPAAAVRPLDAHELEHVQRQLALLESIHKSRKNVSPEARAAMDALEAKILAQLHELQSGQARVSEVILSGIEWVAKFPGSRATSDLVEPFKSSVERFIAALTAAGAIVTITSTLRPPKRAHLMHFCWQIAHEEIRAEEAPPMDGVNIHWVHPTDAETKSAAQEMVNGYGLVHIAALSSRHTEGRAIDMSIQWSDQLVVKDGVGAMQTIASLPRNGSNAELHLIGSTFGVKKLVTDPPHWSEDGH
jgi:hypothetical protein